MEVSISNTTEEDLNELTIEIHATVCPLLMSSNTKTTKSTLLTVCRTHFPCFRLLFPKSKKRKVQNNILTAL